MLRLLLGMTDCVLHGSKNALGPHLCAQLIRVTLEQFIRSLRFTGPKGDLWNMLIKFCRRWIHRKSVIEQWNTASLALTTSLMDRLHPLEIPHENHDVIINWADRCTTIIQ